MSLQRHFQIFATIIQLTVQFQEIWLLEQLMKEDSFCGFALEVNGGSCHTRNSTADKAKKINIIIILMLYSSYKTQAPWSLFPCSMNPQGRRSILSIIIITLFYFFRMCSATRWMELPNDRYLLTKPRVKVESFKSRDPCRLYDVKRKGN